MSLSTVQQPKQYPVAIIASKGLDDPDFLDELIGGKVASISHIYTNGANDLVLAFARSAGIPFTVYPLTGGRSLPESTSAILDHVQFVYIIGDPESKSAGQVREACEKRGVKHRLIEYIPFTHWAEKVGKASEILYATTKEEIEAHPTLKALWRVV